MGAIASTIVGLGLAFLGWMGPIIFHDMPSWLQLPMFILSVIFIIVGTALGIYDLKRKKNESGISVIMHDGNNVTRIGHDYGQRKDD